MAVRAPRESPQRPVYFGKVRCAVDEPEKAIETFEEAGEGRAELESSDEQTGGSEEAFLESLDLATAGRPCRPAFLREARDYLAQSDAEQSPAVLALRDEDPEAYRRSVFDASIN